MDQTHVFYYIKYLINGWRFNVKDQDMQLRSHDIGVLVREDKNTGNLITLYIYIYILC